MKKGLIIVIAAIAVIAIWAVTGYNGLVSHEENVKSAWSQVENVYQRRLDLIPNLVATVKGYAEHEQETLESVVAARSKATQITVDPDQLTEENIAAFQEAQARKAPARARAVLVFDTGDGVLLDGSKYKALIILLLILCRQVEAYQPYCGQ